MFQHYGFQSGRDVDKFADAKTTPRAINGVCYVPGLHEGVPVRQGYPDHGV